MRPSADNGKYLDGVLLVFLFAVFVLLPPFVGFWATPNAPWYLPYIVWLGIIVLVALVQSKRHRHEL